MSDTDYNKGGEFSISVAEKRGAEKAKKNRASKPGYRTSKSRNHYTVGICLKITCKHKPNCVDGYVQDVGFCNHFSLFEDKYGQNEVREFDREGFPVT